MALPFTPEQVIYLLGLRATPRGDEYKVICPIHGCKDKSGAMYINKKTGKVHCFKCGFGGDVCTLYAEINGLDNKEAYYEILEKLNMNQVPKSELYKKAKKQEEDAKKAESEPLREIEERTKTYETLMEILTLEEQHKKNLIDRGFDEATICLNEYRSTSQQGMQKIAAKLLEKGCYLQGVPGFYRGKDNYWTFMYSKPGIFIPVRDSQNRIQALQFRVDDAQLERKENGKLENKYRWLSSKNYQNGTASGAPIHFACEFKWNGQRFIPKIRNDKSFALTEGPMKGDLFFQICGQPTICVAGVNATIELKPVLEELKSLGVEKIFNLFDMDYITNEHVQEASDKIEHMIKEMGFEYFRPTWDSDYKGIDDYYVHIQREKKERAL